LFGFFFFFIIINKIGTLFLKGGDVYMLGEKRLQKTKRIDNNWWRSASLLIQQKKN